MKNKKSIRVYQLNLFEKITPIETVVIQPTKKMPLEVFKECWHKAYFMELMERLPDGRVLWDEERSDIVSDTAAEAEYFALQNDWLVINMELPKRFVETFLEVEFDFNEYQNCRILPFDNSDIEEVEVIGNIHDNPELIKS